MGKQKKQEFHVNMAVSITKYEMLNLSPIQFFTMLQGRLEQEAQEARGIIMKEYYNQNRWVPDNTKQVIEDGFG